MVNGKEYEGNIFAHSAVKNIQLPSTLKRIEAQVFLGLGLRCIKLPKNVEYIGSNCFSGSALEEITLPASLVRVEKDTFDNCWKLRIVWLEDGCTSDVNDYVGYPAVALSEK